MQKVNAILILLLLFWVSGIVAQNRMDEEIRQLTEQLVAQLNSRAEIRTVAIADFTNLDNQATPLGKFLAEECRTSLIGSTNRRFTVINRSQLEALMREAGMDADGLINSNTAARLGRINGIDAIVFGVLTPTAGFVRVNLQATHLETTNAVAGVKANITRTPSITALEKVNEQPVAKPAETDRNNKGANPQGTEIIPNRSASSYRKGNIEMELRGCRQTGAQMECSLKITSRIHDTDLYIYTNGSRIMDATAGYEYSPANLKLADQYGDDSVKKTIVGDHSAELILYFSNIRQALRQISRLDIHCWSHTTGHFIADLRNITVTN